MRRSLSIRILLAGAMLTAVLHAQVTLIKSSFDGVANDTNGTFGIISNAPADGSGASWNQTTGFVKRGTARNSTVGGDASPP